MKKVQLCIVVLMVLCLLPLALFAGGETEKSEEGVTKKVTVTQWSFPLTGDKRDEFTEMEAEFEAANPNIDINIEFFPWQNRLERFMTAIAGRQAPDTGYLNGDYFPPLADQGGLLPLDEYLSADFINDIKHPYTWRGHIYILPILETSMPIFYNTEIYKQAGLDPDKPPETWDDFFSYAEAIKKNTDAWPWTQPLLTYDAYRYHRWLWQAGGDYVSADGTKIGLDTPEGLEAMNAIQRLFQNYVNPAEYALAPGEALPIFGAGKAAMAVNEQHWIKRLRDAYPEVGAVTKLGHVLKNKRRLGHGTVAGYCIFSQSKQPAETAEWIKFMTSGDNVAEFCSRLWFISPRKSVDAKVAAAINDPAFDRAVEESAYAALFHHPIKGSVDQIYLPNIQQVAMGRMDPKEALKSSAEELQKILDRYNKRVGAAPYSSAAR